MLSKIENPTNFTQDQMRIWEILLPLGKKYSKKHYKRWYKFIVQNNSHIIFKPQINKNLYESGIDLAMPIKILSTKDSMDKIGQFSIKHFDRNSIIFYSITEQINIVNKGINK
jgi:hypothetical protein